MGLCLIGGFSLLFVLSDSVKRACTSAFVLVDAFGMLVTMFAVGVLMNAVMMPFVFKYGTEKGRIVYFLVIAICGVVSGLLYGLFDIEEGTVVFLSSLPLFVFAAVAAAVFAVSWWLSVRFYEKRELS